MRNTIRHRPPNRKAATTGYAPRATGHRPRRATGRDGLQAATDYAPRPTAYGTGATSYGANATGYAPRATARRRCANSDTLSESHVLHESAVDVEILSHREAGKRTGEENGGIRDVLGLAQSADHA